MRKVNLRSITNSFLDVRLVSLAQWPKANEISPRDRGGPYVVLQAGYDPADPNVVPDEFVLGRSGKWLSLSLFYRLPVPERRAEYIFGTAAEVMSMMSELPSKVQLLNRPAEEPAAPGAAVEGDEMAAVVEKAKRAGQPS